MWNVFSDRNLVLLKYTFALLLLMSGEAIAQHKGLSFQAMLKKPDGTYPNAVGLSVTLQVLDPVSDCVLREEVHSGVNITNGYVNLVLGSSSASTPGGRNPAPILTIPQVMDNSTTRTGLNCVDANNNITSSNQTYIPADTHARKLRLRAIISGDTVVADFNMRAIAYAVNAENLGGKAASSFVQTSAATTQANVESVFSRYAILDAILSGTYAGNAATATALASAPGACPAGQYMSAMTASGAITCSAPAGSVTSVSSANLYLSVATGTSTPVLTVNVGTAANTVAAGNDARFTDSRAPSGAAGGDLSGTYPNPSVAKIAGKSVVLTTPAAGEYLKYDGTNFVNATVSTADATKLPLAGGTMSGAIDMASQNLTNVGYVTMASGKSLHLSNNAADPAGLVAADKGKVWFNSTSGQVKYWDGTTAIPLGAAGSGIQSFNGMTGTTQTLAIGTAGTAPAWSSVTDTHTLNIPMASTAAVTAGLLSKTDYDAFTAKIGTATAFTGDVTGTSSTTSVDKIKGKAITEGAYAAGQTLRYDGTAWVNAVLGFSDLGSKPTTLAGYGITDAQSSALADGKILVGNASNVATAVSMSGDATIANTGAITLATVPITKGGTGVTSFAGDKVITTSAAGALQASSCGLGQVISYTAGGAINCTTLTTGTVTSVTAGSGLNVGAGPGGSITATGTLNVDSASANTASKIVTRDASGNFAAGAITNTSNVLKGATAGTLTMTVPATVTSYSLTWPAAVGGAGAFLTTDASGNLSWGSPAAISDATYVAKGAVQFLTDASTSGLTVASGVVNVNSGTGANQIVKLTAASKIPAVDGSLVTNLTAGNLVGAVPIANGGTGQVTKTAGFDALSPNTTKGDLAVHNGTNNIRVPAGTDAYVLTADSSQAAGVKWSALPAAAGDASYAAKGLVEFNTDAATSGVSVAAGVATVNAGTGANQIVKLDGTSKLPAVDGSALTNLNAGNIATGTLPIARGGTNSGTALTNGKVMVSTAGAIVEGVASNTAKSNNTFVMRDGSGNIAGALGTFDQFALNGSTAGTVNIYAPASFTSWNLTLPTTAGTNGQFLSTNGSGVTSWVTAAGTIGGSGTTGKIPKFTASGTLGDSVMTESSGNVGVGTTSPIAHIDSQTSGANDYVGTTGFGTGFNGVLMARSARGTQASPTATQSGDSVGGLAFSGYGASAFGGLTANINGVATQNFTNTAQGTGMLFSTTPNNSVTAAVRMAIDQNGNVGIGTTNPGALLDLGTAGTTLGTMRFEGNTSGYVQIQPAAAAGSWSMTLPATAGTSGYVLSTNGSGVTSWVAPGLSGTVAIANGGTGQTTKTAAFDALSPNTTKGDLAVHNGTNNVRLPAGTDAFVLTADSAQATGLKWAALPSAPVDSSYAAKGLVQFLTDAATSGITIASGVANVNSGTGANQIVKLDAASKLPAVDGSALTNLSAANIATGTLPIARGGTNSATALTNGKVMVSTAGAIVEGVASATAKTASTFVMRDGSGNLTGALGTFDQLAMNGSTAGTLNVYVPASFTSWNLTLPTTAGTNGQVLATNGSGVTSWATALTATTGFINGGNSFTAVANLGTNDAYALNLKTNNTTKMSILSGGNVGIGTTAPDALLDIVAPTGVTNDTLAQVTYPGSATAHYPTFTAHNYMSTAANGNPEFELVNSRGTSASPTALLNGDMIGDLNFAGASDALDNWKTAASIQGYADGNFSSTSSPGYLLFTTTPAASTTSVERMRITSTGYVGIGTTAPASGLDVVSQSSAPAFTGILSDQYSTDTWGAQFTGRKARGTLAAPTAVVNGDWLTAWHPKAWDGTSWTEGGYMAFVSNGTVAAGSVPTDFFITTGTSGMGTERLRILSGGNVGIATATPAQKLDVVGNIKTSGCLYYASSSLGTCASDARIKKDVHAFDLGLDALLGLNPVKFKYNGLAGFPVDGIEQLGVIAQDVEKTAPQLVKREMVQLHPEDQDKTEIKVVDYGAFTYVMINSIKDLYRRWTSDSADLHAKINNVQVVSSREIASLKAENEKLKQDNASKAKEMAQLKARMDKIEKALSSK